MSRNCELFRQWLPWYAAGALAEPERGQLIAHLATCAACREALALDVVLVGEVRQVLEEIPSPREDVWEAIRARTQHSSLARVDLGSFVLGISLWLVVRGRQLLLRGDLRLLGRRYPLFAEEG